MGDNDVITPSDREFLEYLPFILHAILRTFIIEEQNAVDSTRADNFSLIKFTISFEILIDSNLFYFVHGVR